MIPAQVEGVFREAGFGAGSCGNSKDMGQRGVVVAQFAEVQALTGVLDLSFAGSAQ